MHTAHLHDLVSANESIIWSFPPPSTHQSSTDNLWPKGLWGGGHRKLKKLWGCFEATDWDALCETHGDDINAMTECVNGYINSCEDNSIPTRTVRCFSNENSWITCDLKKLLNTKKGIYWGQDRKNWKSRLETTRRYTGNSWRTSSSRTTQEMSGMKKITNFNQKEDQIDASLGGAN